MKKNILSAAIAATLFAVAGSSVAASNIATDTATVTTTVRALTAATVTVTPVSAIVTTDEIQQAGTHVAAVDVEASGLYNGTTGANVKLTVDSSHYQSAGQAWKFISDSGESFSVVPALPSGWNFNGDNVTTRTDNKTSVPVTRIDFETKSGNAAVSPGNYNMPVTLSFNTW
ncbi:hypothetical protein ACORBL_004771 [Escherichia coli]|nr:hypothetical protein [Escherichia coli]